MAKITFLGTSSMIPSKSRNLQAIFMNYGSEGILVDCAEGTQRQFQVAGISITKITKILITHWHGDHVLGLPGLLQSLGSEKPGCHIEIYGPEGTNDIFCRLRKIFPGSQKKDLDIKIIESKGGIIFSDEDIIIECMEMKHSVPVLGYSITEKEKRKVNMDYLKKKGIPEGPVVGKLQKGEDIIWNRKKISAKNATKIIKGKKITFILDTALVQNCYDLARNSDILICESTYNSDLSELAVKRMHLTSEQAASIAKKSHSKKLLLTHFSRRYKETENMEKDAKNVFKNTVAAKDMMEIEI